MSAIGMRYAYRHGVLVDARRHDRNKYPVSARPDTCVCRGCGTPVNFRTGYEHHRTKKWVYAIFRLPPDKKHREGCEYDVGSTLTRLARCAENVADADGKRLLEELEAHQFRVRLKLLGDAFGVPTASGSPLENEASRMRRAYLRDPNRLPPYVVLARGLVRLYQRLHAELDPDEFEQQLQIDFDGRRIQWADFVFEAQRRADLYASSLWDGRKAVRPFATFVTPLQKRSWDAHPAGLRLDCKPSIIDGMLFGIDVFAHEAVKLAHVKVGEPHLVIACQSWKYDKKPRWIGIPIVEPGQIST